MILSGLTESLGFLVIVPLLSAFTDQEIASPAVAAMLDAVRSLGLSPTLGAILWVFVALIGVRSLVQFLRDRAIHVTTLKVIDGVRLACLDRLLGAEWTWIARQTRTDHMSLVMTEVPRVAVGLNAFVQLAASLATVAAYLVAALIVSPGMALFILASGLCIFLVMTRLRRSATKLGYRQVAAHKELMKTVEQSLRGLKLAKILGAQDVHRGVLARTVQAVRQAQLRFQLENSASRSVQQIIAAALLAFYVYAGFTWFRLPLIELLALAFLFSRIMPLILSSQQNLHHWLNAATSVHVIHDFLEESQRHAEPVAAQPAPVAARSIALTGVTVRYADRATPALRGVSLTLAAGTTTAVTGRSGAGKSTLADVLMGLQAPDTGALCVDDVTISAAMRLGWRAHVAYVPQETVLYHDTIAANLRLGAAEATEAQLWQALGSASADFVKELPDGLDTVIGDNGQRLSGGERQRLALARALLRTPGLLILDEATSALDRQTEQAFRGTLDRLHGVTTIVVISHRPDTLGHVDQWVTLDGGTVVHAGPERPTDLAEGC